MARPETLVPGNCYFSVGFYDREMRLPIIQTLVFVKIEPDADGGRLWLFAVPPEPSGPDAAEEDSEPQERWAFPDEQLGGLLDVEGLMAWLREVAFDHPLTPVPLPSEPATDDVFDALPDQIAAFLDDEEIVSLTMMIRFVDDGVSVSRVSGAIELHFYAHPRRTPDKAASILALFDSLGVRPSTDYLSDRGRTRILAFPIPRNRNAIVDLCRRVLLEVSGIRHGDVLDYHPLRRADVPRRD